MPKFVIERTVPGAGVYGRRRSGRDRCQIQRSPTILGPDIQWAHSYVTADKITCVYIAANEELIRQHGRCGGFPVDAVYEVRAVIDPVTAEVAQ